MVRGTRLRLVITRRPVDFSGEVMSFVTALALVLSGATAYLLQRAVMNSQIDDSLKRSVLEFRILAQEGSVLLRR